MVQFDLQRIVLVGSIVAVIAKAIAGTASYGSREAISIDVRSRKGVVIGRSLVVGPNTWKPGVGVDWVGRIRDSEIHNRRLVRVVTIAIALEYMASVVPNIGHIDAGLVGKLPLNGCIPRVHHGGYEFVRPNVGPHVERQAGGAIRRVRSARPKQRKDSVGRDYGELVRSRTDREIERGSFIVVGRPVDVLVSEHRQVLRDGVSKQRSEDADVVTAAVTHAYHGLWIDFVGDSQPRGKLFVVVASVSVVADVSITRNSNLAFRKHREAAVSLAIDILGRVELPAQAIVHGQF